MAEKEYLGRSGLSKLIQLIKGALSDKTTKEELTSGLEKKQNTLIFDETPQEESENPVKSSGIYTALQEKADLVEGKIKQEQLPEMDYDPAGSADSVREELQPSIEEKQDKITATGILKGTGDGNIVVASSDTDYATPDSVNNKLTKPKKQLITIRTNGGLEQQIDVPGVQPDESVQEIHIMPKSSDIKSYIDAGVYCSGQGMGTLTFSMDNPLVLDIEVYITIWDLQ